MGSDDHDIGGWKKMETLHHKADGEIEETLFFNFGQNTPFSEIL